MRGPDADDARSVARRGRVVRANLRTRTMVAFGLVSLLIAGTLAVLSYSVARSSLLEERREAAMGEAYTNARAVRTRLRSDDQNLVNLLAGLQVDSSGQVLLRRDGRWYTDSVSTDSAVIPTSLRDAVEGGAAGVQVTGVGTAPVLVVGVPIAEAEAGYFQVSSLGDLDRTLNLLGSSLVIGAIGAAIVGAATGAVISGRVIRPLRTISAVAGEIAAGRSDARLDAGNDPDLAPLADSFNGMVDELEERARREARFASDISHDLRGPLTAFSAAVSVVNRRRAELPPEASAAVDALDEQVEAFNRLVVDLLEISRFEAGTASLQVREVDVLELVRAVLGEWEGPGPEPVIRAEPGGAGRALVDPRRIQQVLANLLENAANYAGGATQIVVEQRPRSATVRICVDDAGDGVPVDEREAIFERFHRGTRATTTDAPRGTGLGLALAAEHVRLHGGRLWVEDAPTGGARFVIELPTIGDDR